MDLRQMRLTRGWKIKDLEYYCREHGGVSAKTLERAENGVKIDAVMAYRIALALDVKDDDGNPDPSQIEGLNY